MAQTIAIVVFDFVFFCQDRSFIDFSGAPKSDINNKKIFIVYNNFIAMNFDLNSLIKSLVAKGLNLVPFYGNLLSELVTIFWPNPKTDVWSMIKDQVQNLVDQAIFNQFYLDRKADLAAIKDDLDNYNHTSNINQMDSYLAILISKANNVYQQFKLQKDKKFCLQIIAKFAVIHILILKQRIKKGEQIDNYANNPHYEEELSDAYDGYKNMINTAFSQWKKWYINQVIITAENIEYQFPLLQKKFPSDFHISNKQTGQQVHLHKENQLFDQATKVQQRMINEAVNTMISFIMPFYQAARLVPQSKGQYIIPKQISTFQLGPYCPFLRNQSSEPCPTNIVDCTQPNGEGGFYTPSDFNILYNEIIEQIGFDTMALTNSNSAQNVLPTMVSIPIVSDKVVPGKTAYLNGLSFRVYNSIFTAVTTHQTVGGEKPISNSYGNAAGWDYHYNIDMVSKTYGYAVVGGYFAAGTSNGFTSANYAKLVFKFMPECVIEQEKAEKK